MDYFDRFKARMGEVGTVYRTGNPAAPKRPIPHLDAGQADLVNQLVDQIIGCRMKGLDFDQQVAQAKAWAEYEWGMVEPALAAKRAERQAA